MPPESGIRPILLNAWMKLADFAAIDDVAGERDIRARAGSDAVDRAHHRQRQRTQARAPAACSCARSTRRGRPASVPGATARSPRSCPAQKPRPAPVSSSTRTDASRLTRCQCVAHLGVHRVVETVQPIGPVERQTCDPAVDVEQNVLEDCHACLERDHYTCMRCCTTRKRLATNAESVSAALAAGLAPVP